MLKNCYILDQKNTDQNRPSQTVLCFLKPSYTIQH